MPLTEAEQQIIRVYLEGLEDACTNRPWQEIGEFLDLDCSIDNFYHYMRGYKDGKREDLPGRPYDWALDG